MCCMFNSLYMCLRARASTGYTIAIATRSPFVRSVARNSDVSIARFPPIPSRHSVERLIQRFAIRAKRSRFVASSASSVDPKLQESRHVAFGNGHAEAHEHMYLCHIFCSTVSRISNLADSSSVLTCMHNSY
eukprot:12423350-Karenia_brevis.AAC.2